MGRIESKRGRYDQSAPPNRMPKYPQNVQGPPMHGPPNNHMPVPPQAQNYNNNYHNSVPPMQQHPPNHYYGPPNNGNYDQSAHPPDQYAQNYNAPGFNSNGYTDGTAYSQPGYQQPSDYDQHQQYSQDYKCVSFIELRILQVKAKQTKFL